jgi:hypothetical protein
LNFFSQKRHGQTQSFIGGGPKKLDNVLSSESIRK